MTRQPGIRLMGYTPCCPAAGWWLVPFAALVVVAPSLAQPNSGPVTDPLGVAPQRQPVRSTSILRPAALPKPGTVIEQTYDVTVGLRFSGRYERAVAAIALPVESPEQSVSLLPDSASAGREIKAGSCGSFLVVDSAKFRQRENLTVERRYRVKVKTVYQPFSKIDFPPTQPKAAKSMAAYLKPSPGIESTAKPIVALADELGRNATTDWDRICRFHQFTQRELQPVPGPFTSALGGLKNKAGDCEEKSALFIALCRATGLPARTIWTPGREWTEEGHCYAEVYLVDNQGVGHWIPVDSAGGPEPGQRWVAQPIFQKGDQWFANLASIRPNKSFKPRRLLGGWSYHLGRQSPTIDYLLKIVPVGSNGSAVKPDTLP